ncbi:MAG: glutamate--tRNA ligase [Acholeplasmatales bacterium]|jgi:glutamyl-tRNA synthetase|nr:glutamate--tRNA ligase [Acholeplasmatales bacterium]
MDYKKLAEMLYSTKLEIKDLELRYPSRNLDSNSIVTRIAPSPTGFIHLGNLYNAIIGERLAHQSNGVFYLRIEDTDLKREVKGAIPLIIKMMDHFDIRFDEGRLKDHYDFGDYGPYQQRERKEIYHVFAKKLVELGYAYPCFASESYLNEIREVQRNNKEPIGCYGKYAKYRDLTIEEIKERIDNGESYVLRFRADYQNVTKITVNDLIKGPLTFDSNIFDFVLLKSDGIPTYHFAHVVDDYLMRTTHVVRGEEWMSSLPFHINLFNALGLKIPFYCHTPLLMKYEDGIKRKLSKRKDKEFSLEYYLKEGYPKEVVWNYLLTVLNSNYEEWKAKNIEESYNSFKFSLNHLSRGGTLFDNEKLINISKEILSHKSNSFIYENLLDYTREYRPSYYELLITYKDRILDAINIGRLDKKVRKDIVSLNQACDFYKIYFDELLDNPLEFDIIPMENSLKQKILTEFLEEFDYNDTKDVFASKINNIAVKNNFCTKMKEYQLDPSLYSGSIADIYELLRVSITSRKNAPDIYDIIRVIGNESLGIRVSKYLKLTNSK